ncbi:MAG: hypothetical protein IT285_08565 [Bdellovibrionales bacterium]|nr:hypothetical protein [Bdellovibrionales bacterium]
MKRNLVSVLLMPALAGALSGCGILFGSVKPIEGKSEGYRFTAPSKADAEWKAVEQGEFEGGAEPLAPEVDVSDRSWQHQKTGAILSINSACRPRHAYSAEDLRQYTDLLFLGFSDLKSRQERRFPLQREDALETTAEARMDGVPVKFRAVVTRRGQCLYDLMYVAKPAKFESNASAFSSLVGSLRFDGDD